MMESKEIIETARFSDLGLDSITGMEWVRHINQVMDLSLEADVVYKHKTLKRFVEHIESMLNHRNTEKVFTDINTMGEHQSLDAASVLDHVEEGILDVDTAYKLLEEAL
jgi:polyketide synthase PksL